jgi:integrase/recombinase XerD
VGQDFVAIWAVFWLFPQWIAGPYECEAGALTTELTAPNRTYFTLNSDSRKQTPLASSESCTSIETLLSGYQLCAATEGKSRSAIQIVVSSVAYFRDFLVTAGQSTDVGEVGPHVLRAYILYLQQKPCFASHRFNRPLEKKLSGHTVNCYLRSLRIFFSWLVAEEVIAGNPFDRVKIPRPPARSSRCSATRRFAHCSTRPTLARPRASVTTPSS